MLLTVDKWQAPRHWTNSVPNKDVVVFSFYLPFGFSGRVGLGPMWHQGTEEQSRGGTRSWHRGMAMAGEINVNVR
jgi:hypothetical protein